MKSFSCGKSSWDGCQERFLGEVSYLFAVSWCFLRTSSFFVFCLFFDSVLSSFFSSFSYGDSLFVEVFTQKKKASDSYKITRVHKQLVKQSQATGRSLAALVRSPTASEANK